MHSGDKDLEREHGLGSYGHGALTGSLGGAMLGGMGGALMPHGASNKAYAALLGLTSPLDGYRGSRHHTRPEDME